jgi:GNAT superfamily N-acetyltransferase
LENLTRPFYILNSLRINLAEADQYSAIYGILALAAEHMHRVERLSHWYPFPSTDHFLDDVAGRSVYAIYVGDLLVGTFNLGTQSHPDYQVDLSAYWHDAGAPAVYFSAFALLPAYQQQGIGSWCMAQIERIVQRQGFRYIRFYTYGRHEQLQRFYTRLGCRPCGTLYPQPDFPVMVFEKAINLQEGSLS